MSRLFILRILAVLVVVAAGSRFALADTGSDDILGGNYDTSTGSFTSVSVINEVVGADFLYNSGFLGAGEIIGNVEGGLIWDSHEVFDRSALGMGPTVTQTSYITPDPTSAPEAGEYDFHATMVGNVLAGTGYTVNNGVGSLSYLGAGMAPYANLWSGAIATNYSSTQVGSFDTTQASFLTPYKAFFNGINGVKPDVINSSWGETDPTGTSYESMTIDGLARQNPTVAFVAAAGNGGPGGDTIEGPGSAFNGITVGSLGGVTDANPYMTPSDFSSSGPLDFYNPQTGQTITGVRAGVDIAAPGEGIVAAAYLGPTGSLQSQTDITQDPSPTDLYFVNEAGTSFAAPVVAGGVALLKNVANSGLFWSDPETTADALDSRVIKAVLMAGATATTGWNNGQTLQNGVIRTTQSLDYATGAGRMNLVNSSLLYVNGTHDVAGLGGGSIQTLGWDYGGISLGQTNDYTFDENLFAGMELTVSLNWFVDRAFDNTTNDATDLDFADLNLHVYLLGESGPQLVAESVSTYNNTEFLRFLLSQSGQYEITVTYDGTVYNLTGGAAPDQNYGLAWQTETVPEPSSVALLMSGISVLLIVLIRRRVGAERN